MIAGGCCVVELKTGRRPNTLGGYFLFRPPLPLGLLINFNVPMLKRGLRGYYIPNNIFPPCESENNVNQNMKKKPTLCSCALRSFMTDLDGLLCLYVSRCVVPLASLQPVTGARPGR